MVGGFNTNVRYLGRMFHVQTEDGGRESPQIITLLYEGGAILHSKKSSYELPPETEESGEDGATSDLEERIKPLMEEQHRVMLEALKDGKLDSKIGAITVDDSAAGDPESGRDFGAEVITDKPLDELVLGHFSAD